MKKKNLKQAIFFHLTRHARLVLVTCVAMALVVVFREDITSFLGIGRIQAASYQMQTGYYVGDGASKEITGLGFVPEIVIITPNSTAGSGAVFKTTAMPQNNVAYLGTASANDTASQIQLTTDGFIVTGELSNTVNVVHTWVAFSGSDCSAGGQLCVGAYTGTGAVSHAIETGFDPDLVLVKQSTAVAANWRSSVMPDNYGQFFMATAEDTTGGLFSTLDATGFTVGSTNNASGGSFYFIAFKEASGVIDVGTYTGNGVDERSISTIGFKPNWVVTKQTGAVAGVHNSTESYGDNTSYFTDAENTVNAIQALEVNGFQVGTSNTVNADTLTYYYAGFGGATDPTTEGSFSSVSGSYIGNGNSHIISNLGFKPDLVIVTASSTEHSVFTTSQMGGDSTAYLGNAAANFTGGITTLSPNGFTVGSHSTVNQTDVEYHWVAYGNAWNPDTQTGASDFIVGAYYGNGLDDRAVKRLPFQPDMLVIKHSGVGQGIWRSSEHTGDSASFFHAASDSANTIQAFTSDGFQIGTTENVNTENDLYWYFGFATGTNFSVGTYTGTGVERTEVTPFQPDHAWVKTSGATQGVMRSSTVTSSSSFPFINTAPVTGGITGLPVEGLLLGTSAEVNTNTDTYRYAVWSDTTTLGTATFAMQTGYYIGDGGAKSISGLGFTPDVVILKADTIAGSGALLKTTAMPQNNTAYLSGPTTDNTDGAITLTSDGFRVTSDVSNTANSRYTWIAFSGNDCSPSGQMCVMGYTGDGTAGKSLSTGFSPNLVLTKSALGNLPSWRSSSMPDNYAQYFTATAQSTSGLLFTTLDASGFSVGNSNNTLDEKYYAVAFKEVAGVVDVGSYVGTLTVGRSIAGFGMTPDFVFIKNANDTQSAVYSVEESNGDYTSYFTDTANVQDAVRKFETDGIQVGNHATVNQNGSTHYYAAFAGAGSLQSVGTYVMNSGTYVGTGDAQVFSELGFTPDLVIIKGNTLQAGVFSTRMMGSDSTSFLDFAQANFSGGITALLPDSFTIGTNATVNSPGVTYYWTAFGNAWNPDTQTGASDFVIGAYTGNGLDARNISRLPFTPDMLTVKRNGTTGGVWRTASHIGDSTSLFTATANNTNRLQAFNTNGFQVGTDASVNNSSNLYWYFAFATSSTFNVGTYGGTGSAQNVNVGLQPYHLWVKGAGATQGVQRFSEMVGDGALPFVNAGLVTNAITGILSTGFSVNTAPETNTLSSTYYYAVWKKNLLQQMHYHFRADDGDEESASSLTGGVEDTPLSSIHEGVPYRIRIEVSNGGEVDTVPTAFRIEYAEKTGTCSATSLWTRVSDSGGAFDMYDTPNLTEGSNTTNIGVGDGGVTDENTTFLSANGGVRDTSDETGSITLSANTFAEFEYSVQATEFAVHDTSYCFRVSNSGTPLSIYEHYPEVVYSNHMSVTALGTQAVSLTSPSTNGYLGGTFVFTDIGADDTHSITDIQISENGTVHGLTGLANIKLFYEYDTTVPYDCASEGYDATEGQFGLTAASFSAANGEVTFSGSVTASSTQAVCMYPVLDVTNNALSGETIELFIATSSDVVLTGGQKVRMDAPVELDGTSTIVSPLLNQMHYHFRLDDGNESSASSATGGNEDTPLEGISKSTPRRIRMEVSNEGSASSNATTFRLEYALRSGSCSATDSGWTDVAGVGGAWDMYDSSNLTEGDNTTNIALGIGGVTDENSVFLSPNGGVRDTSSETGALVLATNEFIELEYSVTALSGALDGGSYCFRLTDQGTALRQYSSYPEISLEADVFVSALGSHTSVVRAGTSNTYMGGSFVIDDLSGSRNVTQIVLSESGTVNANQNLSNIRLHYELDESSPYTCASESFDGIETQFGSTVGAFSSADGTATFTGSTVPISTVSTMCVYAVLDVSNNASDGDTIVLSLNNPSTDVVVSTGTVNPDDSVGPAGTTTIARQIVSLEHFHFRQDTGSEALAESATNGIEDVGIINVIATEPQRLRLAVSNTGSTSTDPTTFTLQYTEKVTTCSAGVGWQDVGATGAVWSVSESSNLTHGEDTTNISAVYGGVTDEATTFLTPNSGVIELSADSSSLVLDGDTYVELEYVIEANGEADPGTTYCFKVLANDGDFDTYEIYPEATLTFVRDFLIQRGVSDIANGSSTVSIIAGVDYTAPSASTSAYIRITNSSNTGAGSVSGGGTQNADRVTTSILNPEGIETGITFIRSGTVDTTRMYWEIVEYTGPAGGDNEIQVRAQSRIAYDSANTSVTTPGVEGVNDDADVVVFITGQQNPAANITNYHAGISTAEWNSGSDTATFRRGAANSIASVVSYAVVEFTGLNWKIQRSEHTYVNPGATEFENIIPVNDVSRAFLHTQKRVGANQVDEFGHQVWLPSVGQIYYSVPATALSIGTHVSVAWVIENTQTNGSPLKVTRSSGSQALGGAEPSTYSIPIGATLSATNNASIFMNMWALGNNTAHPQAIMGAGIISTNFYELWISDTGSPRAYRTEIVDWPTAELTLSQNYYRWFVNNDALTVTDAWPEGVVDIGENTAITSYDAPPTDGDVLRLRMSVAVRGSNVSKETLSFKLQYGERVSTCGAIANWSDIGDSASTTLWRGYNATPLDGTELSTDPPTPGELLLSVSDRAGTLEESNPTAVNPYKILIGEDIEYDWIVEANGVTDFTSYCFRMIEDNGRELFEYTYYPTVGIAGFYVEQQDWRWFDDELSLTPVTPFSASNTAPSNISQGEKLKLRVLVDEQAGRDGLNTKFKLQWSQFSDFSDAQDVADMDTCSLGSEWCYFDGAGTEGTALAETVLEGADACSGGVGEGCGTHNEYSYTPDVVGEVGTTTTDSGGTVVMLQHTYDDPVFIVEAISGDSSGGSTNRPAVAIITATTTSSFTVRIQEPDNELDTHGNETVSYIVMERGSYLLPDGRKVDVNTIDTTHYYGANVSGASDDTCSFTQTFSSPPVVLSSLQTNNNTGTPDFLTASVLLVTSDDFACSMEVPDGEANIPSQVETIGWIAIEDGVFTNNGIALEVTTTSQSITGWSDTPWYEKSFTQLFTGIPGFIATKRTRNGAEGGWVRYDTLDTDSVQLAFDERDDGERTHTEEIVSYLAHSNGGVLYRGGVSEYSFSRTTTREFEFTLTHFDARSNVTYFFRLYDVGRDAPVGASMTTSYPSLSTQEAVLTFSIEGVSSGVETEGVTADVTTTATALPFGSLTLGVPKNAVQRLVVSTNASEGYQILAFERQDLISTTGSTIEDISGTNIAPVSWSTGCSAVAESCYGYHVGDNTLVGGSNRFLANDTYAPLTGSLAEVAYSSGPVTDEATDIIYRVNVEAGQPAGKYESKIVYIIIPVF